MKTEDLQKKLSDLQADLFKQNTQSSEVGRGAFQPHPKFIHNLRKDIARIKTILRERGIKT